jgi:CubicO group peptidase (beta-lactamase class C family)
MIKGEHFMLNIYKIIIGLICFYGFINAQSKGDSTNKILTAYEKTIIELQKEYYLPSISVAIISNKKIIYAKGFGYADIERKIAATDSTPYRIASITKTIASTIILKLVENGKLKLDGKLKDYWPDYFNYFNNLKNEIRNKAPQYIGLINNYHFERGDITLRQQLSHTSEGIPGENFQYSGFLYSQLSKLVDVVSDKDFYTSVKDIILNLNMNNSLPQQSDTWRPYVIENLAKPYFRNNIRNNKGELVLGNYPNPDLGAGAGIVSTVLDLAKFDIALDSDKLISKKMKELAFTPTKLNDGRKIPYGFGWFIGKYKNHKVVYHTGWQPLSFSGLYLKVIDKDLTLILLANSEDLIAPFMNGLEAGQINTLPFAKEFLDLILK